MTKTLLVPCMLLQVFLAQAQIQIATDTTWGLSFSQNGPFDLPIYVVTNCLNEAYIDAQCGPDYGSPMVPTHFADCPGMKPLWVAPAPANCYYPPTGDYWFKKEFNLCGQVLSAMAKVQADQKFTFYLNGTLIGASGDSDWDKLLTYNVTSLLKPGPNTVLIRADNIDGGSCFNYAFLAFCLQINTNNGPLVLTPMADLSACSGQPVQLQATPGGVTYAWSPDASLSSTKIANPTASPATTTTYTVTITDACGNTLTDDVMVSVLPAPAAAAANSGPYCPGDTVLLQASGGTSYFWNGPAGFSSSQQNPVLPGFSAAAAGVYSVAVFSADGCSSTASTLVTALSLASITINYPPKLCITAPPLQLVANPPGGVWGGAAAPNGLIDPSALGSGSHSFTYTYTPGSINCTSLVFRTFEIVDVPQVEIQEAGPFCIGSEVQSLVASPPGGAWGGAAFQFGLFDPTAQGLGLHGVTYTVVAAPGCSATDSITVEVIDAPFSVDLGPDFAIKLGETITPTPTISVPLADLVHAVWQPLDTLVLCPECLSLSLVPVQTTTYSVQLVDQYGCVAIDSFSVVVDQSKPVYVPNAFSPNDDGVNDLFSLFANPAQVRAVRAFSVFSRWGELVYEAKNFAPSLDLGGPGWDGKYRGKPVDSGVYTWLAEILFIDGITLKLSGNVLVVR